MKPRANSVVAIVTVASLAVLCVLHARALPGPVRLWSFRGPQRLQMAIELVTIVSFLVWFRTAHRNIQALGGPATKYTSAAAVWSWLVPLLNLVRPYQIAIEIWTRSHAAAARSVANPGRLSPALPIVWWLALILSAVADSAADLLFRSCTAGGGGAKAFVGFSVALRAAHALNVAAALLAIGLVLRVQVLQRAAAERRRSTGFPTAELAAALFLAAVGLALPLVARGKEPEDWKGGVADLVSLAAGPDRIVGATGDGAIWTWNPRGGAGEVLRGSTVSSSLRSVALTPDGGALVVLLRGAAELWDLGTRTRLRTVPLDEAVAQDGMLHVGSSQALVLGTSGGLRWSLESGAVERIKKNWYSTTRALSPDGRFAAAARGDELAVLDLARGTLVRRIDGSFSAARFLPDGSRLLLGDPEGDLSVFDHRTGSIAAAVNAHEKGVFHVLASHDGRRALTAGGDGALRLWDIQSGTLIGEVPVSQGFVTRVALSPDADWCVVVEGFQQRMIRFLPLHALPAPRSGRRFVSRERLPALAGIAALLNSFAVASGPPPAIEIIEGARRRVAVADGPEAGVFDLETGMRFWGLPAGRNVRSLRATADGRRLAVAWTDNEFAGTLGVFDLEKGTALGRWAVDGAQLIGLRGNLAVLRDADMSRLQVWDLEAGRGVCTISSPVSGSAADLRPEAFEAIVGGRSRTIHAVDLATGAARPLLTTTHRAIRFLRLLSGGSEVLTIGEGGEAAIHDLASGRLVRSFRTVTGSFLHAAVDGREQLLAVAAGKGPALVFRLATGELLHEVPAGDERGNSLAFTPDGSELLVGRGDGRLQTWRLSPDPAPPNDVPGQVLHTANALEATSAAMTPDAKRAVTSSSVLTWDLARGEPLSGETDVSAAATAISADGTRIALASQTIELRDAATGERTRTLQSPFSYAKALAMLPSPDRLLSAHYEGLCVWDVTTGQLLRKIPIAGGLATAAIAANGKRGLFQVGGPELWDLEGGFVVGTLPEAERVRLASLSSDGSVAITCTGDRTLQLWDMVERRALHVLTGHAGRVSTVAISGDGLRAASAGEDLAIRVWDVRSGRLAATLRGHRNTVAAVALSADGRTLVSAARDRSVRLWRIP